MQLIDNDTPNRRISTLSSSAHAGRPQKARAGAGKRVNPLSCICWFVQPQQAFCSMQFGKDPPLQFPRDASQALGSGELRH